MECGGGTFETWLDTLQYVEFVAMTRAPLASCWFATFGFIFEGTRRKSSQESRNHETKNQRSAHSSRDSVCKLPRPEDHGVTCHQVRCFQVFIRRGGALSFNPGFTFCCSRTDLEKPEKVGREKGRPGWYIYLDKK